jgi:hypothetical protein
MRSSFLITLIAITRLVCGGPVAPDNDAAFGGAIDEELAGILNNSTLQMSGAISEKADGIAINPNSSEPIALSKLSGPSQILQMHNSRRYYHQVAPLRWSQGLANFAQSWANQCHYGHTNDVGTPLMAAWALLSYLFFSFLFTCSPVSERTLPWAFPPGKPQ